MSGKILAFIGISATLAYGCAPPGPSAYIDGTMIPDESCVFDPADDTRLLFGSYDIATSGEGSSGNGCENSYLVNVHLNSNLTSNADMELGRAEPNVLQIHSAQVTLLNLEKATLLFQNEDGQLPNPFLVVSNYSIPPTQSSDPSEGLAPVEVIPAQYAPFLQTFADDNSQILAEIQIFGTTLGNVDVEFQPYEYPIRICDGCLTKCMRRDVTDMGFLPEDVIGDQCPAQSLAGMDGRMCLDPGC